MRESNRQASLRLTLVPNNPNDLLGTLSPAGTPQTGLGMNYGNMLVLSIDNTGAGAQALSVDILTQANFNGAWAVLYAALAFPAAAITVYERTVNGFAVRARALVGGVPAWDVIVDAAIGAGI